MDKGKFVDIIATSDIMKVSILNSGTAMNPNKENKNRYSET